MLRVIILIVASRRSLATTARITPHLGNAVVLRVFTLPLATVLRVTNYHRSRMPLHLGNSLLLRVIISFQWHCSDIVWFICLHNRIDDFDRIRTSGIQEKIDMHHSVWTQAWKKIIWIDCLFTNFYHFSLHFTGFKPRFKRFKILNRESRFWNTGLDV